MRRNMRFAADRYYIKIGNDKLTGKLVSDDGKEINIRDEYIHAIPDGRYSIRDAPTNPRRGSGIVL